MFFYITAMALFAQYVVFKLHWWWSSQQDHREDPKMSVQVLERVVEVGLAYKDGPVLVQIPRSAITFIATTSTGLLKIGTPGLTFRGTGITHEASKKVRQELGWERAE